ncbi:hypothetical protein [Kitasatospora sp. MBT63]|uniref:hypothetical protein n=1 Tax=Kitasatospora sp. MBT63 TaxID=1444768 RepID=UPI0011EA6D11|nr:hypothetical protein [Kitasatospora sp. MBT63]
MTEGQIYESCHPLDEGRRVRVVSVGPNRAEVETIGGPPRRRPILLGQLHATALSKAGRPRRTGYRLVQSAAKEPPGQRPTASNITDIQLDDLYERLNLAADLAHAGRCDLIRRLCTGAITPEQARAENASD